MSEYKTIEEERAALVKRIEKIDAEAGFKPGWYLLWDNEDSGGFEYISTAIMYDECRSCYQHVEPFHKVAHKFLPPGWKVVPPETGNLYDWSKAPDWAKYCATDEEGEVWWYEIKPGSMGVGRVCWSVSVGKNKKEDEESVKLRPSVLWDQSLEQRPRGV